MNLWVFLVGLIGLSAILTNFIKKNATKFHLIDIPNERSSHLNPTPRGGGIAIIITFFFGLVAVFIKDVVNYPIFISLLVGGSLIAAIGWVDDMKDISAKVRFFVHLLAAVFVMVMIGTVPKVPLFEHMVTLEHLGYVICVLGIVWSVNLFNFMDGIDGIAAFEAIFVALGGAAILYFVGNEFYASVSLVLLAFSILGFLFFNFPPAKIFMGDVCSGFLGFTLAVYAVGTSAAGIISPWCWMILYGVFFVDATVTLIRRLITGQKWYQAHSSHGYQILSRRYNSHRKVTLGVLSVNVLFLMPCAIGAALYPGAGIYFLTFAYAPLIIVALKIGAGKSQSA